SDLQVPAAGQQASRRRGAPVPGVSAPRDRRARARLGGARPWRPGARRGAALRWPGAGAPPVRARQRVRHRRRHSRRLELPLLALQHPDRPAHRRHVRRSVRSRQGACRHVSEPRAEPFDHRRFLATAPERPGVYVMYDESGNCLYVGKARDLKRRVANYFRSSGLDPKTRALKSHIAGIELHIPRGDNEALLLEYNLIQSLKPRYNVMMRDDKSYPYIRLTDEEFPRLVFYRGSTRGKGRFFGPYANAGAVREVLAQIHKI